MVNWLFLLKVNKNLREILRLSGKFWGGTDMKFRDIWGKFETNLGKVGWQPCGSPQLRCGFNMSIVTCTVRHSKAWDSFKFWRVYNTVC